jgi:hypothetical protein
MKAKEIVQAIVAASLHPQARAAGFKKKGFNFRRRLGSTVQVVGIQLSTSNVGATGRFYVNVGIAFDALWRLAGDPIREDPPERACHFRARMEQLVAGCPAWWDVSDQTDVGQVGKRLAACFERAVAELDRIDGPQTFLDHPWGDDVLALLLRPRLLYVVGDLDGAWHQLEVIAAKFADRRGMTVPDLVRRQHLKLLELRLEREEAL